MKMWTMSRSWRFSLLLIAAAAPGSDRWYLATAAAGDGPPGPAVTSDERPNLLVILIDDLGWADLACYGNGSVDTPNIDRLAAEGMRFTDAYAAGAVCSPTRASLMTGLYPPRVGITDFIPGHWRPWEMLVVPPVESQLALESTTLAELVGPIGYRTAYLGKWHLGGTGFFPGDQGFQRSLVQAGRHFGTRLIGPPDIQLADDEYLAERLTDEAIDWMAEVRDDPFLLVLSHYAVHIPLQAREEKIAKYRRRAAERPSAYHPTYLAMIEHVDDSVGRLLEALEALDIDERTMVVLLSDNGGLIQRFVGNGDIAGTNSPLRGEKGTLYEGGIRIPLIARWPGRIAAGETCRVPVSTIDVWPTLARLADINAATIDVDGISLYPVLTGDSTPLRPALYWHYPHYHHMDPAGAIRAGRYKLIEHFDDGELELFDLEEDLGESINLAGDRPELAGQLREQLAGWRQRVGAAMPETNPDHDPQRAGQWQRRPR